jgi:phage baseplate assembly protein W
MKTFIDYQLMKRKLLAIRADVAEALKDWRAELYDIHARISFINSEIEGSEELRRDYQPELNELWDDHDTLWNEVDLRWRRLYKD